MNTPPPSRTLTLAQLREQAEEASQLAVAARQMASQAELRLARVITRISKLEESPGPWEVRP